MQDSGVKKNTRTKINNVYYSGTQVSVFIGDIWVDDCVSISWQKSHNRNPVYGYGSQHFDLMPKGTILVTGELAINFREPNYLNMILKRYANFNSESGETAQGTKEKIDRAIKENRASFPNDPRVNLDLFFNADPEKAKLVQAGLVENFSSTTSTKSNRIIERMNHNSFNITIGYGDLTSDPIGQKINSVQLMSQGKAINPDGRNILEVYSFIARDMS